MDQLRRRLHVNGADVATGETELTAGELVSNIDDAAQELRDLP
jgi:hypothetical protein